MTYEELWEAAYAIGYHRGRMRQAQDQAAIEVDRQAFDELLDRIPTYWHSVATKRHNEGITQGEHV